MLSTRQSRILQFIKDHTQTSGHSPSVRTIAEALGLRSPASVQTHLKTLERDGYVRLLSHQPRILDVNFTGAWAGQSLRQELGGNRGAATSALTLRQRRVLEYIHQVVTERGVPPSIREICGAVDTRSTSAVHADLVFLERKGFIRRDPTKPRSIRVRTDHPEPPTSRLPPAYAPLLSGQIAAGPGLVPDDQVEQILALPRELVGEGELFVLQVRGDSMIEAGIFGDDYVIVRRQTLADNGDIVAATVPEDQAGEEAVTVKRWCRSRDGRAMLLPANPAYDPIDASQASIVGKVVGVFRRL